MNVNEDWLNKETGKYKCPFCDKEYTKKGISTHIWRKHGDGINFTANNDAKRENDSWNKGLTKETDERVKKGSETFKERIKSGEIIPSGLGRVTSKKTKIKISESMKIAHKEGRAWNIGMSRWNNEMSYPEKFFSEVIENEFLDKNYENEFSISIYSIDFAWVDKKLAIEIDGQQHEKPEYKSRDMRKDNLLNERGWKVLRIKWVDMYKNPKYWIEVAKDFIH